MKKQLLDFKKFIAATLYIGIALFLTIIPISVFAEGTAPTATPGTPSTQPVALPGATPAATPAAQGASPTVFQPLTQLPGVKDVATATSLPNFFNVLYKLCIGAAAVLAVLQIMRAGVLMMTQRGSAMQNEQAKTLISGAVFGLILVLSPVILFSIINPDILHLSLNVSNIQPSALSNAAVFTGNQTAVFTTTNSDRAADAQRCTASSGTITYSCTKKDGSGSRTVQQSEACAADENSINTCSASAGAPPTTVQSCQAQYNPIKAAPVDNNSPLGQQCGGTLNAVSIPTGCCGANIGTGYICCGVPVKTATQAYQAAYYFNVTPSGKPTCTQRNIPTYPDQASCTTDIQKITSQPAQTTDVGQISAPQVVQSCTAGNGQGFIFPPGIPASC